MTRHPVLSITPRLALAAACLCLAATSHAEVGLPADAAWSAAPAPAQAETQLTAEQQFKAKLRERDRTYRKLHRLDTQAAAAVKRGEQPLELFAQQQSTQDILNGLELRITLTASRHGWEVPAPPAAPQSRAQQLEAPAPDARTKAQNTAQLISPEGPARTRVLIRREVHAMLAALAFRGFPQADGGR